MVIAGIAGLVVWAIRIRAATRQAVPRVTPMGGRAVDARLAGLDADPGLANLVGCAVAVHAAGDRGQSATARETEPARHAVFVRGAVHRRLSAARQEGRAQAEEKEACDFHDVWILAQAEKKGQKA